MTRREASGASVEDDVDALRRGDLSAEAFAAAFCDRLDDAEPDVIAFVDEDDRRGRLHQEVRAALERWPDPAHRPTLFGWPVGVKDIIHVDGLATRAGSAVDPHVLAGAQATVVTRLRDAGAVIAGKTVTAQFANFTPGPTRNPHNIAHTPGGSSSGSAAAVAAGVLPLAVGTQTVGSVIRPAAFCGVVGFKATHGRIAAEGVIPHSPSFDTLGIFTRDVGAAAQGAPIVWSAWDDDESPPQPPVIAVPDGPYLDGVDIVGQAAFTSQRDRLEDAGIDVRDVPLLGDIAALTSASAIVNRYELAATHARWFDPYRDGYDDRTAAAIEHGRTITRSDYESALASCRASVAALDARCDELAIDLLLAPSAPGPAPRGLVTTGDPRMNLPWTVAGRPALSLPAGVTGTGLPLGLQVVGRRGADEALLRWGAEIEAVLGGPSGAAAPRPLTRPPPYSTGGAWAG